MIYLSQHSVSALIITYFHLTLINQAIHFAKAIQKRYILQKRYFCIKNFKVHSYNTRGSSKQLHNRTNDGKYSAGEKTIKIWN